MRIIDYCPNCFCSAEAKVRGDDGRGKKKKKSCSKLYMPFEKYAILVFGDNKLNAGEFYSKFYTAPAVQSQYFGAGKKYAVERKHKVKKRELQSAGCCKGELKRYVDVIMG